MADFTAKDVMALREQTGAGMMDCKRALVDANGDMTKAAEILRERGIAKAAKRASKIAAEGIVYAYVEGNVGVLVEVNCESDFVAKGEKFHALADTIAKHIAATKPATVEELLASDIGGRTVETLVQEQTGVIGEKISVRRFQLVESAGLIETYIHMGGTMGVILNFACEANEITKELAHNVALHVAFAKPQYLTKDEVSQETLDQREGDSSQRGSQRGQARSNRREDRARQDQEVLRRELPVGAEVRKRRQSDYFPIDRRSRKEVGKRRCAQRRMLLRHGRGTRKEERGSLRGSCKASRSNEEISENER